MKVLGIFTIPPFVLYMITDSAEMSAGMIIGIAMCLVVGAIAS